MPPPSVADTRCGHLQFTTDNADFASERVGGLYRRPAKIEPQGRGSGFSMRYEAARFGSVAVACADVRNWAATRDAPGVVVLGWAQSGQMSMGVGAARRDCAPQADLCVNRPSDKQTFNVESAVVWTITASFEALAARHARMNDGAGFDLVPERVAAGTEIARALTRQAKAALAEARSLHPAGLGVATLGFEELLLNLFAAALAPAPAQARNADIAPVAVRRARDYIRDHAAQPIVLADLAADLGVSMRALQENFHRSYGVSPRDFLVQNRLELAHGALSEPGEGRSVTDIAFASGFGDLSHFSMRYREKYGELPSQTLRGAGGAPRR